MRRSLLVTLLLYAGLSMLSAETISHSPTLPPQAAALLRAGSMTFNHLDFREFPANASRQSPPWPPSGDIRRLWPEHRGSSSKELSATAGWFAVGNNVHPTRTRSRFLGIFFLLPTVAGFVVRRATRKIAYPPKAVVSRTRDICFVAEQDGGMRSGNQDGFGLYYHECRYLSGYQLRIAGCAPTVLFSSASKPFMTEFELAHQELQLDNGDSIPEGWLGITLYRVVDNQECAVHDVLTLENYGDKDYEIPLSLRFDSDFENVGTSSSGAGQKHDPVWRDGVLMMAFDGADGMMRRLDINARPEPHNTNGSEGQFRLRLRPHKREQVTLSFRIVEAALKPPALPSNAESESVAR